MTQDVPAAKSLPVREKEEAPTAARERPACSHQVLHALPGRRHGQDPEVRDTEMHPVESLPPRLLVAEELTEEAGLAQPLSHDRHRTPIRFEEEEGAPTVLWCALEAETEDAIGLDSQTVGLALRANLDLPAEGKA